MTETQHPLISAIIPVHNGQSYLAFAIQSVLEQSGLFELEVIIIDDGSTDNSSSIATQFSHDYQNIHYHHQAPQGASAARNNGVSLAKGDYIAFLDADDLWVSGKLAKQLEELTRHQHADMVFCLTQQFISPELNHEQRANIACPSQPMQGYIPSSILIKKSKFEEVGVFQTQWRVGEFIDWYSRAQELGYTSTIVTEVLLKRRLHLSNMGITQRDSRQDFAKILKASLDRKRNSARK